MGTSITVISIVLSVIFIAMFFFLRKIKTELCLNVSFTTLMFDIRIKTFYGLVRIHKSFPISQFMEEKEEQHSNQELMMTPELHQLLLEGMKRMEIRQLTWKSEVGIGNAHHSAVAAGMLWALKGAIIAFVSSNWKVVSNQIAVSPDYQQYRFTTFMKCIIVMNAGNAMLTGYRLYKEVGRKIPVQDEFRDRSDENG